MAYTGDFNDYRGGKNFLEGWYNPIFNKNLGQRRNAGQISTQIGVDALLPIGYAAGGIAPFAYQNLADIIASRGKTDPAALNRDVAELSRTSQVAADDLEGQLAALGLGGSGVGAALKQSILQGGREKVADRRAKETQLAEERFRSDLGLYLDMITNPALAAFGKPPTPKGPSGSEQALQYAALFAQLFGA